MGQRGNRYPAENGGGKRKSSFERLISAVWPHWWYQASQTRDPAVPEAIMSTNGRYGTRVPNEREQRVIQLVAQGLKNKEVAEEIGTTEHVVKNYLRVIYDKLGLWNRVELALWYESRRQGPELHAWRTLESFGRLLYW